MKNLFILLIIFFLFVATMAKENRKEEIKNPEEIIMEKEKISKNENKKTKETEKQIKVKAFNDFQEALILSESSGVVDTVHIRTGCTGLFQFSSARAKDLNVDLQEIKKMSAQKQKHLFKKHVKDIKKKIGKEDYACFRSLGLTDGSMVAIAHLGGVEGLKMHVYGAEYKKKGKICKKAEGYDPNDGKTKLSTYREKFKNYDNFLALF